MAVFSNQKSDIESTNRYNKSKKYVPLSQFFLDLEDEDEGVMAFVDEQPEDEDEDEDGTEPEVEKTKANPYLKHPLKVPEKKDKKNTKAEKDEKKQKVEKEKDKKKITQEITTTSNVATTPIPIGAGDGRKFLDFMNRKMKKKSKKEKEKVDKFPLLKRFFS
jgi:hypothetical protein